jgi:hypothetical protein
MEVAMQKFMCTHTLPPHGLTIEQVREFARAAQEDPVVRGYRSFLNLSEGKVLCVIEAPDKQALSTWFQRMGLPVDTISPVELEGERGTIFEEMPVAMA